MSKLWQAMVKPYSLFVVEPQNDLQGSKASQANERAHLGSGANAAHLAPLGVGGESETALTARVVMPTSESCQYGAAQAIFFRDSFWRLPPPSAETKCQLNSKKYINRRCWKPSKAWFASSPSSSWSFSAPNPRLGS